MSLGLKVNSLKLTMTRTAKCACGGASISVKGSPTIYGLCHCTNCRRRTGSAFGMSSYFSKSDVVESQGEFSVYSFHHAAQNHDQDRHFCTACGSTLYWYNSALPDLIGISAGCFDDNLPGEPQLSVTDARRYDWLAIPDAWRKVPN
jgi:hypothetical protein